MYGETSRAAGPYIRVQCFAGPRENRVDERRPGCPRARCAVEKLQRESPESERQRGGLLCTPAVVSPRLSHSGLSRRSALSGPPVRGNTATMSSHLLC